MLNDEIAKCCKELKLSKNMVEMSQIIKAENHEDYLYKLLKSELEHRDTTRRAKLLSGAGFYSLKDFKDFRFDEVTLPAELLPNILKMESS